MAVTDNAGDASGAIAERASGGVPIAASPRRRFWRVVLATVAVVVALLIGVAAGNAGPKSQVSHLRGQLATARHEASTASARAAHLQSQLAQSQAQVAQARAAAASALATAKQQLSAQSAQIIGQAHSTAAQIVAQANSLKAQAQTQLNSANQMAAKLTAEQNTFVGDTIPGDGLYQVGKDIKPGTYHTAGPSASGSGECYWATLASSDTTNIIANNGGSGPQTIQIGSGVPYFQTQGCQAWTPTS